MVASHQGKQHPLQPNLPLLPHTNPISPAETSRVLLFHSPWRSLLRKTRCSPTMAWAQPNRWGSAAGSSHNTQNTEPVSSKDFRSFVLRKDAETLLKAKHAGVPCYAHVENQALCPKAAEHVGEPGLQPKAQQEDAQGRSLLFPSFLYFSILAAFIMLQIVLATAPLPLMFNQTVKN